MRKGSAWLFIFLDGVIEALISGDIPAISASETAINTL